MKLIFIDLDQNEIEPYFMNNLNANATVFNMLRKIARI